ncbi:hypothetical protein WJX84_011041 [Apatococcus fuscideae]|uniref:Tubulin/FtsZ GTPase domain-containing protein n=1 Tax=Apatococcus fuscideae TaxID=2026836 RepID=A0AAW1S6L6_9CHLO
MRELITLQVGQCGNQIACKFWELALREHAAQLKSPTADESLSSFFQIGDNSGPKSSGVGLYGGQQLPLKARAIVVDMEEGVIGEMLKGKMGGLFEQRQMLSDVSGSGNNWAQGHHAYGPQYHQKLLQRLRRAAEACDSLQGFLLLHSLGGGTGSGLGTYLLSMLQDEFPGILRFACSVFPSDDDDVVTSPYNSLLALQQLLEHADCVLPLENQALQDIAARLEAGWTGQHRTAV